MKALRCAIYTRKSTEEGLEQGFNSLHAQREACEAYVLSQAGEGWQALPREYDDGGYSGGSMERPGLKQLMADIAKGEIDIVVVYKVDRLTRSLPDFAKMVEAFDARGVSFVSVTQAFNTTNSMGRLTLNVLLSFAQFEREVTAERIRDKIAASKAKGMWMGGPPPLGYDGVDHRLIPNADEAPTVRMMFERYLELRSVLELQAELRRQGVRSKLRTTKAGKVRGGAVISPGALRLILMNPVYKGALRHKEKLVEGAHEAIVPPETWEAVNAALTRRSQSLAEDRARGTSGLLCGILKDDRGHTMRPVHTKGKAGQRYRFYSSVALENGRKDEAGSVTRISAGVIEAFVANRILPALDPAWRLDAEPDQRLRTAMAKVTLGETQVRILTAKGAIPGDRTIQGAEREERADGEIEWILPVRLKHRHNAVLIEAEGQSPTAANRIDRALVRAVAMARRWTADLRTGRHGSTAQLAKAENLCVRYLGQILPLAYMAPDLVEQIIAGRQPHALSLGALIAHPFPMDWNEQRRLFMAIGAVG